MTDDSPKPYTMDEQPTSPGRLLLARAFAHWCGLHHGHDDEEVEAALGEGTAVEPRTRRQVRDSARLIGEIAAGGRLRTFARPFGGGETVELKAGVWEVDDYRSRFASSAIDPKRPFDPTAAPTHWIFLDMDDFNALAAESCGEAAAAGVQAAAGGDRDSAGQPAMTDADPRQAPRFLRLPEVKARTGMSRSTIYNRIRERAFPEPVNLGGNISGWREADVNRWIGEQGRSR